jgi:hypothetical protein
MSEIEYSDDLLKTSENLATVDWDSIEGGGRVSAGTHLMLVKKVGGYMFNFEKYTGPRAKVQLQVIEGPDKGKTQYDDISLPHPQESDGSRNRRVLIASRMGLITKGSKETANVNWAALTGAQVLITVEDNVSKKNGKTYSNVTFDGWQDPAAAPATTALAGAATTGGGTAAKDAYDDI